MARALLGCAVLSIIGCDFAPDIHVQISAACPGPQAYAVWQTWNGRRLRPRQVQQACYRAPATLAERELARMDPALEVPRNFRTTPRGPLPKSEWVTLRLDHYAPTYDHNHPAQIVYITTRFQEDQHLRLALRFTCDFYGAGGGPGGGRRPRCESIAVAAGCRLVGPDEGAMPSSGPVPSAGDFEDGDERGFAEDPNSRLPEDESVPSCRMVCESLPSDDGQPREPVPVGPTPPPPERQPTMDSGVSWDVPDPQPQEFDVPTPWDVPNWLVRDVPNGPTAEWDVPNPRDVPTDVPNRRDVPNARDVPNVDVVDVQRADAIVDVHDANNDVHSDAGTTQDAEDGDGYDHDGEIIPTHP